MTTVFVAVAALATGAVMGYFACAVMANWWIKSGKTAKKSMGIMDKILIFEAALLIVYTIADMWLFYQKGSEPTTLTACVFSICGIENGVMGWIKTNKTNNSTTTTTVEPLIDREEPPDVGI